MSLANLNRDHHFYARAFDTLLEGTTELKYKQAGNYLNCISANFKPSVDSPVISNRDLTNVALMHTDAALSILANHNLSDSLTEGQLAEIANGSLKSAMYILCSKHFLNKFGGDEFMNGVRESRWHFINALSEARFSD